VAKRPMVNPTTAVPEAPMSGLANLMAMKGRDNDSMLVHLSPNEVSSLNKLSGNTSKQIKQIGNAVPPPLIQMIVNSLKIHSKA